MEVLEIAKKVKKAAKEINLASSRKKDLVLLTLKENINNNCDKILKENKKDIENAKNVGLSESLIERLSLNLDKIKSIIKSIDEVIRLKDPVNEVIEGYTAKSGINIQKIRVPLGVVGIIYESRPNVTIDSFILCIKSGNAVILRGGKEAINTNKIFVELMRDALTKADISPFVIGFIDCTNRKSCLEIMKLNGFLDLLIPRGGKGLIKTVVENATVPVIETGTGNCHIYVDEFANIDMAIKIVDNSKTSRVSVCNAAESLLVHKKIAEKFLPILKKEFDKKNVKLFGCEKTLKILPDIEKATEEDFYCEYLDYKMSIKIVSDIEEAIAHILKYSSKHSESIITDNYLAAEHFLSLVDSSAVYVNASTRFTDGFEFGFGAEIGISTQKLHSRGPMGLKDLTTIKFIIRGKGQIRN